MMEQLQRLEEELKTTATTAKDVSGVASEVMKEYYILCQAWSERLEESRSVRCLQNEN